MKVDFANPTGCADPDLIVLRSLGSVDLLEAASLAGPEPLVFESPGYRRAVCKRHRHARLDTLYLEAARIAVDTHPRVGRGSEGFSNHAFDRPRVARLRLQAAHGFERVGCITRTAL